MPEILLCVAYFILIPSVLLGPCAVIWITNADPLQAAPLTFAVRCNTSSCRAARGCRLELRSISPCTNAAVSVQVRAG